MQSIKQGHKEKPNTHLMKADKMKANNLTRNNKTLGNLRKSVYNILRDDGERNLLNRLVSGGIMALIFINVFVVLVEAMQGFPERQNQLFFYIEVFSVGVFTVEYVLRLWTADLMHPRIRAVRARFKYALSPMAIIDIVAILPFYLPYAFPINPVILRLLRLLRLLRIFKMGRYVDTATSKIILSSIQEAVIVLDTQANVLSTNDAAKNMLLIDKKYANIKDIKNWPPEIFPEPDRKVSQKIDYETADDKFYSATINPILAKDEIVKYVVIISDITETVLLERAEKERIKNVFERFVSPEVVEELVEGRSDIQLGGAVKDVSVLFVDIRGFTAFSEVNSPEDVVSMVNKYLGLTSASIQNNGGMIDKYIGDATMAVFNAPNNLENHPLCACKAAWAMKKGSQAIRDEILEKYGVDLQFGIGINTGDAVVGNMGSTLRMDYTAIGDTVNTAARLEANAAKGQIIISDATYQRVKDDVVVTDLGILNVKNKQVGIKIYSLDGLVGDCGSSPQ